MVVVSVLATALAALFLAAGLAHAVVPGYFRGLLPGWVPAPQVVVVLSGIADVTAGVMLALPATRSAGGIAASCLLVVYMVSHVDAVRRRDRDGPLLLRPWAVVLRVGVNAIYLAAAVAVAVGP